MTDDRELELRHKMWTLAQGVLTDTANTRAAMPSLLDEEYAYAREFLLGIAKATQPGNYREPDEMEEAIGAWLTGMRTNAEGAG